MQKYLAYANTQRKREAASLHITVRMTIFLGVLADARIRAAFDVTQAPTAGPRSRAT